jgi:hypothetical protein
VWPPFGFQGGTDRPLGTTTNVGKGPLIAEFRLQGKNFEKLGSLRKKLTLA